MSFTPAWDRDFVRSAGNRSRPNRVSRFWPASWRLPDNTRFTVLAPLVRQQKGEYRDLFEDLSKQGFARARVDGRMVRLSDSLQLDRQMRHDIEVVVDRLVIKPGLRPRLAEAVEQALKLGHGTLTIAVDDPAVHRRQRIAACSRGDRPAVGRDTHRRRRDTARNVGQDLLGALRLHRLRRQLRATQSATVQLQQSRKGCVPVVTAWASSTRSILSCLIPDDRLSFKQGGIEILGPWKELGRWRRHIYQGVADTIERWKELPAGTMLDTAWRELDHELAAIVAVGNRSAATLRLPGAAARRP